jgi:hypothetical protein
MSDAALGKALRMVGCSANGHAAHRFRATASTLLNGEPGYDSAIIELHLAHAKSDKVARDLRPRAEAARAPRDDAGVG